MKAILYMQSVGFEPTPPKRLRPKRSALDHSAKTAYNNIYKGPTETRTRIAGFKVQSDNHYTIGPINYIYYIYFPRPGFEPGSVG